MPPVHHGQWSFDGDTFYVTSSCGHVHPRATYFELDDIFSTPLGDRRNGADHEDHWYEAQLLHFGLPPTKSKATAKMRLMDAFQDGTLDVPEEILEMEHKLTRNWIKQDLEARVMGPSMQPPVDPDIARATATDAIELGATRRPSGDEEGKVFSAGFAGGTGMQGNRPSQRSKVQPPHAHTKRRKCNSGEQSTRPMKAPRCRSETGGPDLQQIQVNTNDETFHQRSTGIPVSVGNGRGRPAPDRELRPVGYQTVPLSHRTTYGTVRCLSVYNKRSITVSDQNTQSTQLPPTGLMDTDGASDYHGYSYKPTTDSDQPSLPRGWMEFQEQRFSGEGMSGFRNLD
ncbi:unnamed protein product [Penicillium egyptiacum]|uniref:Uncharacterized protein n=1 Tax=Penicillium egyptiacum TaxID=1303716 RepID=A0A9W4KQZ9_9EURO|nr:unnamed protein product [Penicillium egyptiacum]